MGIVNGTTNYILTRMTEEGADYARRPGRGPGARARRARPDRRRRGPRRRGQGGHPRRRGLRRPTSSPATCTARGSAAIDRGRHRLRRAARLRRQAAGRRRARLDGGRRDRRCGSTRPWCPGPTRWPSVRGRLQRRVRRGRGGRRAHALRPGRRRACRRPAPCSATCIDAAHNLRGRRRRPAPVPPRRRRSGPIDDLRSAVLPEHRRGRPARRAGRGGQGLRRPRRLDPVDGAGGPGRRGPPDLPHPRGPRGRRAGAPSTSCAGSTSVDRVGGVLRVIGDE